MKVKNIAVCAALAGVSVFPAWGGEYAGQFYGLQNVFGIPTLFEGNFEFTTNKSPLLNPISASDLTSFSLTSIYSPTHGPGSAQWQYGLGDLLSFTYETAGAGVAPLFMLQTDSIPTPSFSDAQVTISGIAMDQVALMTDNQTSTLETATIQSLGAVPEPASWGLMGVSLLGLCGLRKRQTTRRT